MLVSSVSIELHAEVIEFVKTDFQGDKVDGQVSRNLDHTGDGPLIVCGFYFYHRTVSGRLFFDCRIVCGVSYVDLVFIVERSIDGSVVEFSPATREARVQFPVDASFLLNK